VLVIAASSHARVETACQNRSRLRVGSSGGSPARRRSCASSPTRELKVLPHFAPLLFNLHFHLYSSDSLENFSLHDLSGSPDVFYSSKELLSLRSKAERKEVDHVHTYCE